jgi:small-conductance mechanosensitive channel
MDDVRSWFDRMRGALEVPLLGSQQFTLWRVINLVVLMVLLFLVTGWLRKVVEGKLLTRTRMDVGVRGAIGAIIRYAVLLIGLLIIIQTVGIDLTTLNVLAGAVGLGVGFGLQNVVANFIAGLILLFERPIKIGDRIEVSGIEGAVVAIRARATTVVTNDNIAIIIPNSSLTSQNVVNWSYTDAKVRFKIPVGVAYGTDVRLVEKLLLEVAQENADVLKSPAPNVRFIEFGESALRLELRAWTTTLVHRKGQLFSALNFAINDKFIEHGIEIPFPQRVVHLKQPE